MNPTKLVAMLALFIAWLALPIPATVALAQTVETGLVELTDSKIEYFSRGEGEPIVLLPGGTLTVGYLDGLAAALAKAGHRVVSINFRGSGKSTGPSEGVTLATMADDVAGVIKALNIGSANVAGNSCRFRPHLEAFQTFSRSESGCYRTGGSGKHSPRRLVGTSGRDQISDLARCGGPDRAT
ncbi:alpha/beta hydrolase (plasmid) [Rhizobium sp. CC1099]|uniref:alpha/beta fold hydrolase n=1 Tax=Rhizobium sp. CC1099 TaxID=3039160 RepID=UPI0024B281E9|nr:alpha/beta hydrolase [Rhizobium sp. CC1099]WFU90441.1 alpha/beta hydrolase [Rhizobium sp. CC1099]